MGDQEKKIQLLEILYVIVDTRQNFKKSLFYGFFGGQSTIPPFFYRSVSYYDQLNQNMTTIYLFKL